VADIGAVAVFGVPVRSLVFYGLVAVCPLMHLLMGHGSHEHSAGGTPQPAEKPAVPAPREP
jgi:hypothetical protein